MPGNERGPMCSSRCGLNMIDTGTSCRSRSSPPVTLGDGSPTTDSVTSGHVDLSPILVQRNRAIERSLLNEADNYRRRKDFRWFFTYAHGQITRQINQNIRRFQHPNILMLLNIHFSEEFLRAIWEQPHEGWKQAFNFCEDLQNYSDNNPLLIGEIEFCGAAMANIHIHVDLSTALKDVGCIVPQDYGNMLIFVNRGALKAIVQLRGRVLGAGEAMFQRLVAPMVDLEVKVWRNAVYERVCNKPVPNPDLSFLSQ